MNKAGLSFKERFLSHVNIPENLNDCWEWKGSLHYNGYGEIRINKKLCFTHRISYTLFVGPIPDNLHVLHHCDNRACVNPNHLFLGTNYDNVQDRESKGRGKVPNLRGECHGMHKLTEQKVYQIREKLEQGYSHQQIANMFGVSRRNISFIKTGKRWGWLK